MLNMIILSDLPIASYNDWQEAKRNSCLPTTKKTILKQLILYATAYDTFASERGNNLQVYVIMCVAYYLGTFCGRNVTNNFLK